jgi:hypothetical protein
MERRRKRKPGGGGGGGEEKGSKRIFVEKFLPGHRAYSSVLECHLNKNIFHHNHTNNKKNGKFYQNISRF